MEAEKDTLIGDNNRAPIDNHSSFEAQVDHNKQTALITLSTTSEDIPPPAKKKRHCKKGGSKDKRSTEATDTRKTSAPIQAGEEVVIPPEVLQAIKSSLTDDLFQICQQACKQAMDLKDSASDSSSPASNTPSKTNPPDQPPDHAPFQD